MRATAVTRSDILSALAAVTAFLEGLDSDIKENTTLQGLRDHLIEALGAEPESYREWVGRVRIEPARAQLIKAEALRLRLAEAEKSSEPARGLTTNDADLCTEIAAIVQDSPFVRAPLIKAGAIHALAARIRSAHQEDPPE